MNERGEAGMRKATTRGTISEARMLTIEQACAYTGFGKASCRKWCDEIGATCKFGKIVRFDKTVIDRVLDNSNAAACVAN